MSAHQPARVAASAPISTGRRRDRVRPGQPAGPAWKRSASMSSRVFGGVIATPPDVRVRARSQDGQAFDDHMDTGRVILFGRNTCQMFWPDMALPSRRPGSRGPLMNDDE